MFEQTKLFHRVPVGFGPAPTPRQDPQGKRFDWSQAQATTVGVVFETSRESVNALLPEGYEVDPDSQATVMFEVMELRNLPWLAGRGYNTWGVYFNDIVCRRVSPAKKGSYLSVLFESFTDPITTGREELGFPKLWAELPNASLSDDRTTRVHTASWFGYEFLRLELSNLKEHDPKTAPAVKGGRSFTHPTANGFLHHRYVPAVGEPGKHDASYATFCPAPPGPAPVSKYYAPFPSPNPCNPKDVGEVASRVKFQINRGSFEQLPTLHNVVDGLASLQLGNVLEVAVQTFNGASDLKDNKRIEH
ncbi:hypothetical protein BCV70DRAFT_203405 [Testicularia cyperi]|uniref:Acetoacetate decarboxylase n=1 Tax=Testicularia cyperi TaxID=1882483 RepID=A0A317XF15_9BASI|nr:hypothetical protein BCV70DRAFT_203405 [Testicularia cyperi]